MKKIFFTILSLIALLTLSTGTAFAAPLADGYLILREVRNDANGGVIFVFDVVGDFSKSDFKNNFVFFGDEKFPMGCHLEGSVLQCTTSRATAGKYVTVNVGGFIFWAFVPERGGAEASESSEYCYGVYDIYYEENEETHSWQQFETHCQNAPANYGDLLENYENPDFGFPSDYEFMPNDPGCFDPVNVDAYYGVCPS